MNQVYEPSPAPPAPPSCRWCGSDFKPGAKICAVCHRGQSMIREALGSPAAVVSVLATLLTMAQLGMAVLERSNAVTASETAQTALAEAQNLKTEVLAVKGKIAQSELQLTQLLHDNREIYLTTASLAQKLERVSAREMKAAAEAQSELEVARNKYQALKERLDAMPATVVGKVPDLGFRKVCPIGISGRVCFNIPEMATIDATVPNPEYQALRVEVEAASVALRDAEGKLAAVLNPGVCEAGSSAIC